MIVTGIVINIVVILLLQHCQRHQYGAGVTVAYGLFYELCVIFVYIDTLNKKCTESVYTYYCGTNL